MGQIALNIPVVGQPNSTEDPKVAGDFNILQTLVNGNIDLTNLSPAAIQALQASTAPLSSHATIAASESRTNVAYGTLTTPDQVIGLVLPANGLIAVFYQAMWQESVGGAGRAAIFIGANQLQVATQNAQVNTQAAATGASATATNHALASGPSGLVSHNTAAAYPGDVTTGQAVGLLNINAGTSSAMEVGTSVYTMTAASGTAYLPYGGPCYVFAAAGTYTISVQYRATSGSVTASNRKLWVQALPFG